MRPSGVSIGPGVRVVDQFGNPVAGATVNFVVTNGGGSLIGATQTTNAQGAAAPPYTATADASRGGTRGGGVHGRRCWGGWGPTVVC